MKMHDWETFNEGIGERHAVPGGYVYRYYGRPDAYVSVPDPTAPHCQPTPPADDRPPMTDEELRAWLTATYGAPRVDGITHLAWGPPGKPVVYHDASSTTGESWDVWIDAPAMTTTASIAGPALWAAHKYSTP
jgi:hypothetical protein